MKHYWWVLPMFALFVILYRYVPLWLYVIVTLLVMANNVWLIDSVTKSKS